jgi:hypothetical protein
MPYVGELINEGTGFLWIGRGVITGQELIQGGESELSLAPIPEKITHSLVDFTQVTDIEVTIDQVLKVGEIDKETAKIIKNLFMAIVVPTHLMKFLSDVYTDLNSPKGWTIQTFKTRKDAEAWLASVVSINESCRSSHTWPDPQL